MAANNPPNWSERNDHPEYAYSDWQIEHHAGICSRRLTYHEWVEKKLKEEKEENAI